MLGLKLKSFVKRLLTVDTESNLILRHIESCTQSHQSILDVGCGYGRLLRPLMEKGYCVEGVEKNTDIVLKNRKNGLVCHDFDAFDKSDKMYDTIVLSHIIEHFSPNDLIEFLDYYLNRLMPNGHLIIATPFISDYFYDDFDHIKPYLPTGLLMVYGENTAQVQYYGNHKLRLRDLTFRVSPYSLRNFKSMYVKTRWTPVLQLINAMFGGLYLLSGQMIGKKDGWIGVFSKANVSN